MSKTNGKRDCYTLESMEKFFEEVITKEDEKKEYITDLFNEVSETLYKDYKKKCYDEVESKLINKILNLEIICEKLLNDENNTLLSQKNRSKKYRKESDRKKLQDNIIEECLLLEREDDETKIKLTHGGMRPKSELKDNQEFYMVIGLPASGKSSIASKLSDLTSSILLDSDIVKRKFPEFREDIRSADLVHQESSYLLRSDLDRIKKNNIFSTCIQYNLNIVYPTIGDDYEKVNFILNYMKGIGYNINLILVEVSREIAVYRALLRYIKTKRYVPLIMIYDEFGDKPTLTFHKIVKNSEVSHCHIINNGDKKNRKIESNCITNIDFLKDIL